MNKDKIVKVLGKELKNIGLKILRDKTTKLILDKEFRKNTKSVVLSKFSRNISVAGDKTRVKIRYNRTIKWMIKTFDIQDKIILFNSIIIPFKEYTFKYKQCILFVNHYNNGDNITLDIKICSIKKEIIDKIFSEIEDIIKGTNEEIIDLNIKSITMYKCNCGDSIYDYQIHIPKRNADSIFSYEYDNIISDIEKFMTKRPIFEAHSLPFKTGVFLHGEPGTGKSSIVKAVASHFNMNIYYINLAELSYNELKRIVNEINNLSKNRPYIILLEEIDLSSDNEELSLTNDKSKKISILLNWLDGQESPNNAIFMATTNYIDKVDERIKRSGRFDYRYEITKIRPDLAVKMCESFGVDSKEILELDEFINTTTYSPAKLQEYILKRVMVEDEL